MKLVEECSGVGALRWQDQSSAASRIGSAAFRACRFSACRFPGLHRIEGVIELREIAERARLVGSSFTLELEDGRSLKLTLADDAGRVLAEGHGPDRGCSAAEGDRHLRRSRRRFRCGFREHSSRALRPCSSTSNTSRRARVRRPRRIAPCARASTATRRRHGRGSTSMTAARSAGVAVLATRAEPGVGTALMEQLARARARARATTALVQRAALSGPVL